MKLYKRFRWTNGYDPGAWVADGVWMDAPSIWFRWRRRQRKARR